MKSKELETVRKHSLIQGLVIIVSDKDYWTKIEKYIIASLTILESKLLSTPAICQPPILYSGLQSVYSIAAKDVAM
ncbi:hypothetical protein ARMGADRAFT_1009765 [Armillaria gallica]|uniref:Uncharacterized protein n=1 Tax=Armillaria gallica TaxID=47427 RepID=A0A2H3E8Z1_ARMGA|nr:hypothetical protein ARMGADRAFT_1009765 [Armillaria gallica]